MAMRLVGGRMPPVNEVLGILSRADVNDNDGLSENAGRLRFLFLKETNGSFKSDVVKVASALRCIFLRFGTTKVSGKPIFEKYFSLILQADAVEELCGAIISLFEVEVLNESTWPLLAGYRVSSNEEVADVRNTGGRPDAELGLHNPEEVATYHPAPQALASLIIRVHDLKKHLETTDLIGFDCSDELLREIASLDPNCFDDVCSLLENAAYSHTGIFEREGGEREDSVPSSALIRALKELPRCQSGAYTKAARRSDPNDNDQSDGPAPGGPGASA